MRVVAIVLAAGTSSRLGRPKQLLSYGGQTLIRHAARTAIDSGADETIVVVPPGRFGAELEGLDVQVVENWSFHLGVSTSIRAGVVAAGHARLLFTLVDQPLVTPVHLRSLIESKEPIVATGYSGTAGVPVIFAPRYIPQLLALNGDRGARGIIAGHANDVELVDFPDAAVDIDTEEDLRVL
ncbi:MAG TPA: nucleotidyltransferase family protein [Thermoanaerobaculia bacterium]